MRSAFFIFFFLISLTAFAAEPTTASNPWAHSREWLRLLHMEKSWGGYRSHLQNMLGKESFFLAADGNTNPVSEYQATLEKMFSPTTPVDLQKKTQCHFPARRDFLLRHWSEISKGQMAVVHTCPEMENWMQNVGSDSVSLVFASAYLNAAPSSFGHTFLKIHSSKNDHGKDLLDYGINYAARTADTTGALYALYGLLGYFPGTYAMMPYHEMIKEYTHLEGRDMWEYELTLTPEETKRLMWHLLELEGTYSDYYFLNRNCSWAILRVLEVARPDLELKTHQDIGVIPLDSLKLIVRTPGLVREIRYRPSLESQWRVHEKGLSATEEKDLKNVFHKANSAEDLSSDLKSADVPTLDAASDLFALKSYEDHKKFDKPQFAVLKERATRKEASPPLPPTDKIPPSASPDSSTIQAGWSQVKNSDSVNPEAWLGWRLTFHDLLSQDQGASPWSHLEFLSAKIYRESNGGISLGRYRFLELLSTQGVTWNSSPISWGVSTGGDRELSAIERLHSFGMAKVGYSFDFLNEHLRWINMVEFGGMQSFEGHWAFATGLQSIAIIKTGKLFRAELTFEDRYLSVSERRNEYTAQAVLSPWLQWELRAGWHREDLWQGVDLKSATEASASIEHHWIF